MMQILAPRRRLEVPPDMALLGREIDREYPELRRLVDELYGELGRVNGAADEAFQHDALWPACARSGERRETNRYAGQLLPTCAPSRTPISLSEFPRGHAFRTDRHGLGALRGGSSPLPPPFAVARLHGAWTRGVYTLPRGEEELEEFLVERITAYGGRCLFDDRAASGCTCAARNVRCGVMIDGDELPPTGASFVLA